MDSNPLFKRGKNCKLSDEEFFKDRFKRLCDSDINSDCEFLVGCNKEIIKGHKLIFSTASPVFYAMFHGNLKENAVIVVSDLEPKGFEKMKKFIYTDDVNFETYIQVIWTLVTAKKYIIPHLVKRCMDFLHNGTNTYCLQALHYYEYLKDRNITEFNQICHKIIEEKTLRILSGDSFSSVKPETVSWILSFESLALDSELELFNFFEKWALAEAKRKKISPNELGSSFNDLKKHIRFLTMNAKEFALAAKSSLLTDEEKLAIALNMAEFGSTPLPDSLSPSRTKRNFNSK
ncbi:hypothetical protein LSTR_LSTR011346 [Laodelphax striatellus]|uniref:BTB domain-containing protein n=1 Tax=Laodelphax striatellus TaxID=195883 RepID=A0A482XSB4_LAOST|nr:hypothetical protein LSTR_LSTR011346 [Laodelphax striatellus]